MLTGNFPEAWAHCASFWIVIILVPGLLDLTKPKGPSPCILPMRVGLQTENLEIQGSDETWKFTKNCCNKEGLLHKDKPSFGFGLTNRRQNPRGQD